MIGANDVDTCDVQAHYLGRLDGEFALVGSQLDHRRAATAVQVGTEFPGRSRTLHGRDDALPDHETANVSSCGLLDEFLYQEVGLQTTKRIDQRLGSLACFRQYHAVAVGALHDLDHQRGPAHGVDQIVGSIG